MHYKVWCHSQRHSEVLKSQCGHMHAHFFMLSLHVRQRWVLAGILLGFVAPIFLRKEPERAPRALGFRRLPFASYASPKTVSLVAWYTFFCITPATDFSFFHPSTSTPLKPVYLASFFTQSLASVVAAFAFCLATLLLSSYSRSEWPERVKMLKCPGATILMPLTSARTISPDSLTLGSIRGSPDHDCDTTTCSIC